jgi:S1-C subfamily serine protease
VIGINSAIFSKSGQFGGIGFAIPINDAKTVLEKLKTFGRVPRPWLGVITRQVTPTLAYMYGLGSDRGVIILNRVEGAPADRAGIQDGDILLQLNGKRVDDQTEIERELGRLGVSETAKFTIQRGRKTIDLRVKLEEFPPNLNRVREGVL